MDNLLASTELQSICRQSNISYLGLFGSFARGEETENSDVDLLVKFNVPTGYFTLVDVQNTLQEYFNREVDLVTERAISKYMRPGIMREVKTLYQNKRLQLLQPLNL